jgi:hypothetical protein
MKYSFVQYATSLLSFALRYKCPWIDAELLPYAFSDNFLRFAINECFFLFVIVLILLGIISSEISTA